MNMTGFTGNARIREMLEGPLGHAYLISGLDADKRRELALLMAGSLLCGSGGEGPCHTCAACGKVQRGIHPDVLRIGREDKKEIPVAAIRQIVEEAPILPNEAEHKVYLVEEADALNLSAQNAFLKVLEEPPGFVTFLLLAENPLALLPTVRSRCVHLALTPDEAGASAADLGEGAALAERFFKAYISGGMDLLHFCVELEKTDRQVLEAFVEASYARFAEALGQGSVNQALFKEALLLFDGLREDLRFHVSTGHISGKILATRI